MSLPPQLIRIKRKAADEAPVSFLRVQESKRHRGDHFVYQRQERDATLPERSAHPQKPVIHTFPRRADVASSKTGQEPRAVDTEAPPQSSNSSVNSATMETEALGPRQFHISRADMLRAAPQTNSRAHGGVSKKRQAPTVFVERKIKQFSVKKLDKIRAKNGAAQLSPAVAVAGTDDSDTDDMDLDGTPPRKYKKPGLAKFANDNIQARGAKTEAPAAITERWRNVDMGQLSAEMNAYTLEQIGKNIKQSDEEERRRQSSAKKQQPASPLRFKPKAPPQRYAERHPEPSRTLPDKEMPDADGNMSEGSDDEEYIIETYVRVPASRIGEHVPPQTVGLLVFDGEPDIEYFYGDASDSDDEWAEDEEDENAENYYTADYPDDEVASDDEYGQNAYAYRNGNASDLEEYDANAEEEAHHSADEDNEEGRFARFQADYKAKSNDL
ncbi:transcription factor Iwr1 [Microdochium nivale]|nr:transcription factor Iwr1 [Microdochium nivale]